MDDDFLGIDEIIKKVRGRGKNIVIYPIFEQCKKYTTEEYWCCFFDDLSYGKHPKSIYIDNGVINSTSKKNKLSYNFTNRTAQEIVEELIPLIIEKTNICSSQDLKEKTRKLEETQQTKIYDKWSSIKKTKDREAILSKFVLKEKKAKNLSMEQCNELKRLLTTSFLLKVLNSKDVVMKNGKIDYIENLVYEDGIYKTLRNLSSDSVEKNNEIKGISCTLIWDKWIKHQIKNAKTIAKN